jgi:predicted  nucleic acid-binding Zn-ribbon protein
LSALPLTIEGIASALRVQTREVAAVAREIGCYPGADYIPLRPQHAARLMEIVQQGLPSPPDVTAAQSGLEANVDGDQRFLRRLLDQRNQRIQELEAELRPIRISERTLREWKTVHEGTLERLKARLPAALAEAEAAVAKARELEAQNRRLHDAAFRSARLEADVKRLEDKLGAAMSREQQSQARVASLRREIAHLQEREPLAERQRRTLQKKIDDLQSAKRRLLAAGDAARRQAEKLKNERDELKAQLRDLKRQSKTRGASKKPSTVAKAKIRTSPIRRLRPAASDPSKTDDFASAWIQSLKGRRWPVFRNQSIVLLGTGPKTHRQLRARLRDANCDFLAPGSSDAGVIIVGREDWFLDDIEDQIRARVGQELRIYSQELALLAIEHGRDPLETATTRQLKALAKDHPALQLCIDEGFLWPILNTSRIVSALGRDWDEGVGESPLHKIGYHVGKTSESSPRQRRDILERSFRKEIPFTESKEYMRHWGQPGTRRRLRRMATHIRWLVGGAYGRETSLGHDMSVAIQDWQQDLDWMKAHLYEPWMHFRWPSTKV